MSVRRSGNFTHETQVMQALMFICMNFRMTVELSLLRVSIVALCALEQLAGMPALMERQVISVLRGEVILGASEGPLVRVRNHMHGQLVLSYEAFSALRAEVVLPVPRRDHRFATRLLVLRQPLYAREQR